MMSLREKYSYTGKCTFQIFPGALEDDYWDTIDLDITIGGCNKWSFNLARVDDDDEQVIVPLIVCRDNKNKKRKIRGQFVIRYVNPKNSYISKEELQFFWNRKKKVLYGPDIYFSDIIDEKGVSADFEMTFEYGIVVESILDKKIWKFNFKDKIFDRRRNKQIAFELKDSGQRLYCHPQLMSFHFRFYRRAVRSSKLLIRNVKSTSIEEFERMLQIAHGVRLELCFTELLMLIICARYYQLFNVIRYCEQQLIYCEIPINFIEKTQLNLVFQYKLNRFLRHLLKTVNSLEEMKEFLDSVDQQKISSESMKLIIEKFVYHL